MADRGPLCVGIDPHPGCCAAWGLPDDASGLERFALTCAEALGGRGRGAQAAVGLLRTARLGRHRRAGAPAAAIHEAGALSLLDVKRGDIGSTMTAYAQAYLDAGQPARRGRDHRLAVPRLRVAATGHRPRAGAAVEGSSSSPSRPTRRVRRCSTRSRIPVTALPVRSRGGAAATTPARRRWARSGSSSARRSAAAVDDLGLDLAAVNGPLLAPGFGAQGGSVADLRRVFGAAGRPVLPSSSREILAAGPDPAALRAAARRARRDARLRDSPRAVTQRRPPTPLVNPGWPGIARREHSVARFVRSGTGAWGRARRPRALHRSLLCPRELLPR